MVPCCVSIDLRPPREGGKRDSCRESRVNTSPEAVLSHPRWTSGGPIDDREIGRAAMDPDAAGAQLNSIEHQVIGSCANAQRVFREPFKILRMR